MIDDAQTWADIEVGKVSIEPQDGGTARLKFRVQARGEGLEWWVAMMGQGRSITLTPPKDAPLPAEHPDALEDHQDPLPGTEFARNPPKGIADKRAGRKGRGKTTTEPAPH